MDITAQVIWDNLRKEGINTRDKLEKTLRENPIEIGMLTKPFPKEIKTQAQIQEGYMEKGNNLESKRERLYDAINEFGIDYEKIIDADRDLHKCIIKAQQEMTYGASNQRIAYQT